MAHVVVPSPLRLDLRVSCSHGTPVWRLLNYWRPLPLVIQYGGLTSLQPPAPEDEDNIITAVQHPDHIWKTELTVTNSLLKKLEALMQVPFPILEDLEISHDKTGWVTPSVFLCGTAPPLRVIHL